MALLAQSEFAYDMILLAGVIIVVTMLMINVRRRAADRGSSPRAYAREQLARAREQDGMRDDMQELMMQLEQLAREINAQVDTRFAKLEKAIADADARITELRRLGVGEVESAPDAQAEPASGPQSDSEQPSTMETPGQASVSETSVDQGSAAAAEDASGITDASPEQVDDQIAFERRILALAGAGKRPVDIARELGGTIGEVELIIKLKRQDNQ